LLQSSCTLSLLHRTEHCDKWLRVCQKVGSLGAADGQFNFQESTDVYGPLAGIAVDSSGNMYVTDQGNSRIQKFDSNGNFLTKWGSHGTGDGQFNHPNGVAVEKTGNVYVADFENGRIQVFAPSTKINNVQTNHPAIAESVGKPQTTNHPPDAFNQTVVVDNPETRTIDLKGIHKAQLPYTTH
jgi:DNA-binding beta-propeller fold protein YncE